MITSNDVLKAIVDCQKPNGKTNFFDVMKKLDIDGVSLDALVKELMDKNYISTNIDYASVTSLGMSAYKDLNQKGL